MDNNDKAISQKRGGFWTTLPGVLTGVAGVIGAITALIVGLSEAGLIGSTSGLSPSPPSSPPSPPNSPPPAAKVDQFVGRWVNQNRNTDGITRVEIQRRLNTLSVHMWGKCHPTDCDWGTTTTDVSDSDDGILSITWLQSFKEEAQEISTLPDGRIQVVSHSHFIDNSGRPDYDSTHYFEKE